jgi:hypothetical protein
MDNALLSSLLFAISAVPESINPKSIINWKYTITAKAKPSTP